MGEKWKVLGVMAVAIVLAAIGEALASKGMKQLDTHAQLPAQLRAMAGSGHVWIGTALMFGYVLLYVYTLGMAELSFAVPLSAASYLIGVLLAKWYLHEEVKPARWIGVAVIVAGVLIVGLWGSSTGGAKQGSGEKSGQQGSAPGEEQPRGRDRKAA